MAKKSILMKGVLAAMILAMGFSVTVCDTSGSSDSFGTIPGPSPGASIGPGNLSPDANFDGWWINSTALYYGYDARMHLNRGNWVIWLDDDWGEKGTYAISGNAITKTVAAVHPRAEQARRLGIANGWYDESGMCAIFRKMGHDST